jgi:hypothetical protein
MNCSPLNFFESDFDFQRSNHSLPITQFDFYLFVSAVLPVQIPRATLIRCDYSQVIVWHDSSSSCFSAVQAWTSSLPLSIARNLPEEMARKA